VTVTIQNVSRGTTPGDGTGDTAYDGTGKINTNFTNLQTAVESLQGRYWTIQNSSTTVAVGGRYKANNHAGITLTMPGTFSQAADSESDVWIINDDNASNITLTPASGDAFFVNGATNGVDSTYALPVGTMAILSPRTTNSEWDLFLVGSIQDDSVTFAKMQNISTDRLIGRDAAATGDPEELTVGGGVEFTGLGGIQRSALTGDVTASAGSGSTTIANNSVTFAKMQDINTSSLIYRKTAGSGDPEQQTLATLKTDLGLTGTNSGDQTSMSGISDTKANFDTACNNGNFLYVGDVTSNATHTGQVTGSTALTVQAAAITGQTDIGAAIVGTDEFLINDTGTGLRRTDASRVATYVESAIAANKLIDWTSTSSNFSTSGTAATGALTVTGAITATGDITAFYTSDAALKYNALLNGNSFEYNKEDKEGKYYGLMAQDMQKVLPELVHENLNGELTIRMAGFELVALLVEAIKELKEKVDGNIGKRSV
jgi:hypothetical protein